MYEMGYDGWGIAGTLIAERRANSINQPTGHLNSQGNQVQSGGQVKVVSEENERDNTMSMKEDGA